MKFNNYPELINHHKEHVKIDWAITEKTEIPKRSDDKNVLLAYADATEGNLEHIIKTDLTSLIHPIIVNLIYPVGSVIMTTSSDFNPATQFGGTWAKWTDGYLKVDGTPSISYTDVKGATDYKITKAMLPKHTHTIAHTHSYIPSVQSTTDLSGSFTILGTDIEKTDEGNNKARVILTTAGKFTRAHVTDGSVDDYGNSIAISSDDSAPSAGYYPDKVSLNVNHTHTGKPGTTTSQSSTTSGDGDFTNNTYKPKYYAVIAWQRIA